MSVPSAPTITAASNTGSTISIQWTSVSGATGYTITLSPTNQTTSVSGSTTSVSFPNTNSGNQLTASVVATNDIGTSTSSTRAVDDIGYGLVFWVDANDTSTMTFGPNRTAMGGVQYPTVTQWRDKSGRGAHMNMFGTNQAPIYVSSFSQSVMNAFFTAPLYAPVAGALYTSMPEFLKPGIVIRGRHSSATDSLEANINSRTTPITFFTVVRDWHDGCMFGSRDYNDINIHYSTGYHTAHLYPVNGSDGGNNFNSNTTWSRKNSVNNRFVINTLYHTASPTKLRFRLNGLDNPNTNVNVTAYANFGTMRIGRNNGETTEGILCEIMIFNRVLTTTEMQQVEGYLATKWGIQLNLPTTHPFYSTPYTGVPVTSATGLPVVPRTAPVLNNSPTIAFTSIPEDTLEPAGDTVASLLTLLGTNYVPYDAADSKGVAIYSAPFTNGVWQFSTNGGSTWSNMPSLSGTQHYLLAGVASNMIRFVPTADYNGSASLSFRAWDMTSETSGTTVNVSNTGSTTIYSSGTATATITITSVNDAPVMSGTYAFADVNASSGISAPVSVESILSSFTITDADDANAQTTIGLAITYADTAIGTWYYSVDNQTTWNAMTSVTSSAAIHFSRTGLEYIKFVPTSTTTHGSTSIQIRAWDKTNSGEISNQVGNASSGGGTTAYSINTFTLNCAVTIVPEVPTNLVSYLVGGNILLQWTPPSSVGSSDVTSYNVYRIVNGVSTLETTTTTTEATITNNLSVTNTYTFKVAAVSAAGESATTTSFDVYYVVAPGQPTNVSVQSQNSQMNVSWTPPSTTGGGNTLTYKIYNADTNAILATGITGTSTTIQGLTNYIPQRIYVVAENDGGLVTSNEKPVVGLPFVDTPTLPSDTAAAIQQIYTNGGSVNETIASIIQSVGLGGSSGASTTLIQNIVKNVVTQTAGLSPASNIPSVIQTLNSIAEDVSNIDAITTIVTTAVDEIVKNGITQSASSANVVSSIKNTILDTITEIAGSSVIGTLKSDAIQTATTTLFQNTDVQTNTAVTTAIVVSNTDTSLKNDMFTVLATEKTSQIITLTPELTTAVQQSVLSQNKTAEFDAVTNLNVIVPNTSYTIDITNADITNPIYLPLETDIEYTILYHQTSVKLKYNSSVGKLFNLTTMKELNSSLTFGENLFKILQTGTATILYTPPPSAPQNITITSGTNQIVIGWSAPSTPVSSYKVYRVIGGASTLEKTVTGLNTSITTNLTNGQSYSFVVKSVNQGVESVVSDTVTVVYTGTSTTGSGSGSGGNVPCIVKGQRILTPNGYVLIETLQNGDYVLTPDNRSVPVTIYSFTVEKTDEKSAPIRIPAGAFSKSYPPQEILLSPLHAIKKSANVWEIPYAAMKRHASITQEPLGESVTYYHIETPNFFKDLIIVEGSVIEPFGFNYVKQHGYEKVTIYTFSKRLNGYTRFSPSSIPRLGRS